MTTYLAQHEIRINSCKAEIISMERNIASHRTQIKILREAIRLECKQIAIINRRMAEGQREFAAWKNKQRDKKKNAQFD